MTAVSVTFNGIRVNESDSNANWGNWGSTGKKPEAITVLAYQGGWVVSKQINASTTSKPKQA